MSLEDKILYLHKYELGDEVHDELIKAIEKHGLQEDITLFKQYTITAEEFGEIAKGLIENDLENTKEEIAQTIAMLVKLYWLIERLGIE